MKFLFPLLICLSILGAAVPAQQNYIRNGSAELGNAGTGSGLFQMPMWIITTPGTPPTAVRYTPIANSFPMLTSPGVVSPGSNFFSGGPNAPMSTMQQQIDLTNGAALIDTGTVTYTVSADVGGFGADGDNARLDLVFYAPGFSFLAAAPSVGPVTPAQRGNVTRFLPRTASGTVPVGARLAVAFVTFQRTNGSYCDGYLDNMSLTFSPDPIVHAKPTGTACGAGTIGKVAGYPPYDILAVNSQGGDSSRNVIVPVGQNLGISIQHPYPSVNSVPFAIFALLDQGTYNSSDIFPLGPIGTMCLPIFSSDPRSAVILDSVGFGGLLNGSFGGPAGTPFGTTVFGGLPSPVTLAIQGLVIAPGGVVQITNAIRIVVQ